MNKFNTPLDIRIVGDQLFMLLTALEYEEKEFTIRVYSGFKFDGASIPRILWSIAGCPMGGKYSSASCIHDALYASRLFARKDCDKIFHRAMLASGVDIVTAKQMYLAVRKFGDEPYESKTEIDDAREFVEIKLKGV